MLQGVTWLTIGHIITGHVTPRDMPVKVLLPSGWGPAELSAKSPEVELQVSTYHMDLKKTHFHVF